MAEKYPTLAPLDFYAAGAGYRSERSLNAFTLHRVHGEIGPHESNGGRSRA